MHGYYIDKNFNFIYFEMIQILNHILPWSLTFVASVYAPKIINIITQKVCIKFKVKNTSYDSKLYAVPIKDF